MTDSRTDQPPPAVSDPAWPGRHMAGEMHHNVPVWSDPCCCCEAEPYWRAVAEELGIDVDGEAPPAPRMAGQMHDAVPVWSDPCCEAEPYWREAAAEMGIDLDAGRRHS